MSLTKKQKEIDKMKWEKSEQLGKDACGSFDFCGKCDKSLENPCDKAFSAYNKKQTAVKSAAKKPAKKSAGSEKAAKSEVAATAVKSEAKAKTPAKRAAKKSK